MIDRKLPPEPVEEIFFSLPDIHETTLENGLKITYIQKDNLPITRIALLIDCGSKLDPANQKGLANLTSMVIDEGADGLSALEISDAFDTLGSNFSITCDSETISIKLQSLTENLDSSLNIFSKVLLKPDFGELDFIREKKKILTRILQLSDDPDFLAQRIMEYQVLNELNNYAYPSLGYIDQINEISNADIRNFYLNNFRPEISNIVAAGNLHFEEFLQTITPYFKEWKRIDSTRNQIFPDNQTQKRIFLFDKKNSVQSEIRVALPSPKRNEYSFFPRLILNSILGGQFTSRINLNLREDKGYTYGAFSGFNYFKNSAYFYVSTSVGIEFTSEAINEIYKEMNEIRKGITKEELAFAKSSIIKKFPSNFETYRQVTGNLATKIIHSLPDDYFNNYIKNIAAVTSEQVNKAAEDLILPEKAICVIVGEKNSLLPKIKSSSMEIYEVEEKGRVSEKL